MPIPRATLSLGFLSLLATLVGCASGGTRSPSTPALPVVEATPLVVTERTVESVSEMFDRAYALLSEGKASEAAAIFDAVVAGDTSGTYAPTAAFNSGLAWERAGEPALAVNRFTEAIRRWPADNVGKLAAIHATRLYGRAESWAELSRVADFLLAQGDLADLERLEAVGAKALALVEMGEPEAAEARVIEGRNLIEKLRLGEGGQLPTVVAQVQFALGEVRRLKSERLVFVPVPSNFAEVLERRCQGLLDAQDAYTDAMRSLDPHWAAMSGYRVGQLYQQLHADVLAIAPPSQADTPEKQMLFEGAMRLRFRVLLEKGLKMMDHTISLGERTGEAGAWLMRAREARGELIRSLAEQKTAIARLPFREQDLQRALEDLEKKPRPGS